MEEKGKTISVRINSLDTHYMYRDLIEIVEQAGENFNMKVYSIYAYTNRNKQKIKKQNRY